MFKIFDYYVLHSNLVLDADEYCKLANVYFAEQNYEKAIKCFSLAISLKNTESVFLIGRGMAYYCLENKDFAIDDFKKAIENSENESYIPYLYLGYLYKDQEKFDDALKFFNKAIELNQNCEDAYFNRGATYCDVKHDYNKAIKDFECAINLNDSNKFYYSFCGYAYVHKGNCDQLLNKELALADYDKAIEMYKKSHKLEYGNSRDRKAQISYMATVKYAKNLKQALLEQ